MTLRAGWCVAIAVQGAIGCFSGATAGYTRASDHTAGADVRLFATEDTSDHVMPNAVAVAIRQLGDEPIRTAAQIGWGGAMNLGRPLIYARAMFDLLAVQGEGADRKLSALSPTLDVGIAPLGRGVCIGLTAGWDVRFHADDRAIFGVSIGLCDGVARSHEPSSPTP